MRVENGGQRDGNKSRARQKQEIADLRETVALLELELSRLQRRDEPNTASHWQDIAERERQQRHAALAENAKLRLKAEQQLRIAFKLEAASYRRHLSEAVDTLSYREILDVSTSGPSLLDHDLILREMEVSLSALLPQCGAAFDDAVFKTGSRRLRLVEKREPAGADAQVISAERRLCPFDRAAMSEAMLRMLDKTRPPSSKAPFAQVHADLAFSDVSAVIDVARFSGVARTTLMARRYDFESQTLIVLAGMTDPSNAIGVACEGLLLQHSVWVRLSTVAGDDGVTNYEAYHIAAPAVFDVVHDHKRKAALLTRYMHATMGIQMDAKRDALESHLLARMSASN